MKRWRDGVVLGHRETPERGTSSGRCVMSALIVVDFHAADPVDQVLNRLVALQWVHLINLDRCAALLASAAPTLPPRVHAISSPHLHS